MKEITWDEGRVAVLTYPSGKAVPVWLSDDGAHWRYAMNGLARPADDTHFGCTITPLEHWTPPRQDGVWLCKYKDGDLASLRVVDGKVRDCYGDNISDYWTPVKYLCQIPEEWQMQSESSDDIDSNE